jgi:glycosyltransferase involved in cell wall biosynthesis
MNVIYVNGYQSKELLKRRPITRGRVLAGSFKSLLITNALSEAGHKVYSIPFGIPTERTWKIFKLFISRYDENHQQIVIYPAAFDAPILGLFYNSLSILKIMQRLNSKNKADVAVIYNLGVFQSFLCFYLTHFLKIKVVIEYEDDATVGRNGKPNYYNTICKIVLNLIKHRISGCFAVTERLLAQFPSTCKKLLVPGVIADDIVEFNKYNIKSKHIVFTGVLNNDKGVDILIAAWKLITEKNGWSLHISGVGYLHSDIEMMVKTDSTIKYHGYVDRNVLVELLGNAKICVNPHRLTNSPGNIYPFKLYEYIASGAWVITTPIAPIEERLLPACIVTKDDSVSEMYNALLRAMNVGDVPKEPKDIVIKEFGIKSIGTKITRMLETL